MKIGVVPPTPMEPVLAGGHQAVNLWAAFYLEPPSDASWDAAEAGVTGSGETPWSRFLAQSPEALGLDEVVHPVRSNPPAVARAIESLAARGVRLCPFNFPILRNLERMRDAVGDLCSKCGADPGALGSIVEQWSHTRIALKRMDALQGRNAAYPSPHYLETMVRALDPRGDMEALRREIEARLLENQGFTREPWTRLAILGTPPRRREFWLALEELHAVVVYDEWGTECNTLHPVHDLAALWHHCSLPFGLKPRQERLLKEFPLRKVHGALWGAEGLADSLREEAFFRNALGVPLHTIDNARTGSLDAAEAESLTRFVRECEARRGRTA